MTFKRKVVFRPAFDKRSTDPKKNYGVHGADIQFQLIKDGEGITYTIFTNWMLPNVQAETDTREPDEGHLRYMFHKPLTAGCDGHWKKPQYEGQSALPNCSITGGDCYCDGTDITDDLFDLLVAEGDEALWKKLEERFVSWSKT